MAFRRRRFPMRRRFKRRWDMQTFRDCERTLTIDFNSVASCAIPQTFADYVCGIGPSTSPQMKSGASRAVTFGGGHLRVRYNAAVLNDSNMPCNPSVKVVTALIVLPLLEDDLTPAYLPTLAVARSQLSVVPSTESDTDENIVWWHDEQLDLTNVSCFGGPPDGNIPCFPGCIATSSDVPFMFHLVGTAGALYGRITVDKEVKAKRRLKEREALFLLTQFVTNQNLDGANTTWPVRRNVYLRYAVR